MKSIIRKFLSLSLAVVLAAAPLTAFASDALGDELISSNVEVNERTELNAGTFWSNTYSDLRQENYVVYEPNRSVKPIVTSGDYSTQLFRRRRVRWKRTAGAWSRASTATITIRPTVLRSAA